MPARVSRAMYAEDGVSMFLRPDSTHLQYHNISCHKSERNIVLWGFQNIAPYLWLFSIKLCADYLEIENKFTEKNQPTLWKVPTPRNRALEIWRDK